MLKALGDLSISFLLSLLMIKGATCSRKVEACFLQSIEIELFYSYNSFFQSKGDFYDELKTEDKTRCKYL